MKIRQAGEADHRGSPAGGNRPGAGWEESEARRVNLKMEGKFVRVNWARQTSLPEVYAIGDLIGGMMMAHKAAPTGKWP